MKPIFSIVLGFALFPAVLLAGSGEKDKAAVSYAPAAVHFLSTNQPTCFFSDHLTGSRYLRFGPGGTYEQIAREHMGIIPLHSGHWAQATNGMVTLTATNQNRGQRSPEKCLPLTYKQQVFLVWPERSYLANAEKVCRQLDAATNRPQVYNEFLISEEDFTKGTGKPYPFKFHKEMNKVTGAE